MFLCFACNFFDFSTWLFIITYLTVNGKFSSVFWILASLSVRFWISCSFDAWALQIFILPRKKRKEKKKRNTVYLEFFFLITFLHRCFNQVATSLWGGTVKDSKALMDQFHCVPTAFLEIGDLEQIKWVLTPQFLFLQYTK